MSCIQLVYKFLIEIVKCHVNTNHIMTHVTYNKKKYVYKKTNKEKYVIKRKYRKINKEKSVFRLIHFSFKIKV